MKQEEALVLLLGRLSFDKLTKVRIFHLVKNGIDWYEFLNICVKKKLICMAYKNLMDLGLIQLLPMIIINNMQYHYERNQEQNKKFLEASNPIISYFEKNDILAVPVNGLRFLNTIYSSAPGVRILNDIDFIASAKEQLKIHTFMKDSGYDTYLVDDCDAFCSANLNVKNYFFIKFEEATSYGKLRIDFNFNYPDHWIESIRSSEHPIYDFLYLCSSYYEEAYTKVDINHIASYNYVKLIDIHEYCYKYLFGYSLEEIYAYANKLNIYKQVLFTITCLNNLYTDIFHI